MRIIEKYLIRLKYKIFIKIAFINYLFFTLYISQYLQVKKFHEKYKNQLNYMQEKKGFGKMMPSIGLMKRKIKKYLFN